MSRNRNAPLTERLSDLGQSESRGAFDAADSKQFVTALARGLDVLRAFTGASGLLGNREIAKLTGLPKPTISRLTYTLSRLGFLDYDAQLGKYRPGIAAVSIAHAALRATPLCQAAQPLMREFVRSTGVSIALIARDRLDSVCVLRYPGIDEPPGYEASGAPAPISIDGIARGLIVGLPTAERLYVLEHLERRDPEGWPRIKTEVYQALAEYRRQGFTLSAGDGVRRPGSVGVPCIPADGSRSMALVASAAETRMSRERLIAEIGPKLVWMARFLC